MLSVLKITELPINVEEIAKLRGLKVVPYPLEGGVSGILLIEGHYGTIGYNAAEPTVRRRFTIAHELGHYELHKDQSHLFIDKTFKVLFRNTKKDISTPEAMYEQEANSFAAALLMPETLLNAEIKNASLDLGNEDAIKKLAERFDVSTTAMYYRMLNLGKIPF